MHADVRNDGQSSGREKILEGGEMEVRTNAKIVLCGDDLEEESKFAITDENCLTGRGKRWKDEERCTG